MVSQHQNDELESTLRKLVHRILERKDMDNRPLNSVQTYILRLQARTIFSSYEVDSLVGFSILS